MESFGSYLKGLREAKEKTLSEMAESTKIAVSNLEFLESDRFDLLPPRVFVKGFIRSYLNELGENPEDGIRRFDEFTKQGEFPDYSGEDHPVFHAQAQSVSLVSGSWFTVVLSCAGVVALAILLLTAFTHLLYWDKKPKEARSGTMTAQAPSSGFSHDAQSGSSQGTRSPVDTQPGRASKKTLEIKAVANSWVRVEPDDGPAEERLMSPGDVQVFTARETFQLQTGNAGGIKLWYEGRQYPTLGKMNQSLSLTVP
jgi:cytoskeletal protein RodZ